MGGGGDVYNKIILGYDISVEAKGKVHPVTCHEDTQGARRYSSILSLASTLRVVGG